jgi:hypothetical protein
LLALISELNRTAWESKGEKIFNARSVMMLLFLCSMGMLGVSKQAMFEPLFAILLIIIFNRIKIGLNSIAAAIFAGIFMMFLLTPISDDGRYFITGKTLGAKAEKFGEYLDENFSSVERYSQYVKRLREQEVERFDNKFYFGQPLFLIGRFSLVSVADQLIHYYNNNEKEGLNFFWSQTHLLPRSLTGKWLYLDHDKGSVMGRKIGIISDDDEVTGISFGSFAEAFAIEGFWGVVWLVFFVFLMIRVALPLIDVQGSNRCWSMWLIMSLHHVVSETGVLGCCLVAVRTIPFLFVIKKLIELIENLYFGGVGTLFRKGHSH